MVDSLAAPKPPSQSAISCSGRVSVSGSIGASGATLIPRTSRARDLVSSDHGGGRFRATYLARTRLYGGRIGFQGR